MNNTSLVPVLTSAQARQIDQICDCFEAEWKTGRRPILDAYLDAVAEPQRSALFHQLVVLDWDYRRRAGDEPSASDYRARFPDHSTLIANIDREMGASAPSTGNWAYDSHQLPPSQTNDTQAGAGGIGMTGIAVGAQRYDLMQPVGQGGIGIVFRGRDRDLGRELAVKVLRDEHRDKPGARLRLLDEASISSQLQHPSIVPIYDRGCFHDGRSYFTMKLVEGHTFAAMLRDLSDPSNDLTRFLTIFEHICQAMAYAHSRGIIHRDLKPANVMIGAFGEVQVMDWGFAKLQTDETGAAGGDGAASGRSATVRIGASQTGWVMGTPAYMPPEQAQGRSALIDARADVFALGAILCQILTGQPPYVGENAEEICRASAEGDLRDAYARLDACGADSALCELVRHCLAPGRESRPTDAGVVAREMTAYLASVQQRLRQSELERAAADARAAESAAKAKAERRALRLTLALAAALLIGGVIAAWQAVVATRARQAAATAAALEKEAKDAAVSREAETRAVLHFVQSRILAAARPEGKQGGLGRNVSLRQALEAALPFVDQGFADQPLIEARLRTTLGITFLHLDETKTAESQLLRARSIYSEQLGADDPETGRVMNNLGSVYRAAGRFDLALQLSEETTALFEAKLGPEHPDTMASKNNLATAYYRFRRYREALSLFDEILELQRSRLGADHSDTLMTMHNLAATRAALGQRAEALALQRQVVELRSAKFGRENPDTLMTMNNLATSYSALGRHAEAVKLCQEVLALRTDKLGRDHVQTIKSMTNLASGYAALGQHSDALALRDEALGFQKKKFEPDHPDVLNNMWGIANCLISLKRGAEALPMIDDCVRRGTGQTVDPALIPSVMQLRVRHFEAMKDANGCRETAEMWEKLNRTDGDSLYRAAQFRSVTGSVLRNSRTVATSIAMADAEADLAIAWLQKAIAAGYKNAARLKDDPDFAILRGRRDFEELAKKD